MTIVESKKKKEENTSGFTAALSLLFSFLRCSFFLLECFFHYLYIKSIFILFIFLLCLFYFIFNKTVFNVKNKFHNLSFVFFISSKNCSIVYIYIYHTKHGCIYNNFVSVYYDMCFGLNGENTTPLYSYFKQSF